MNSSVSPQICQFLSERFPDIHVPQCHGVLTLDSRTVSSGDIFIALTGSQVDGRAFIPQAIASGAALVLVESDADEVEQADNVPVLRIKALRQTLGEWLFRSGHIRSDDFHLLGVTGTNGKTSVTHYLAQLLEACDEQAAVIGTVGCGPLENMTASTHTTPDMIRLHSLFSDLYHKGYGWHAIEVSSHSLDQQRVAGAPFQAAIFTNLSRDHLDYHGSMSAYGDAKARLFQRPELELAVLNLDDPFSAVLTSVCTADQILTYSLEQAEADLFCSSIEAMSQGFELTLSGRWGTHVLTLPLIGQFNIANVLSALTCLAGLGFEFSHLVKAVGQLSPVAGRMQSVRVPGSCSHFRSGSGLDAELPVVVVDYAHTSDALENALQAIRQHIKGKLWCVFGCGGDRDKGKRPLMGGIAQRYADCIVVTSDNPRTEPPEAIIADVMTGITLSDSVRIEPDRLVAIQKTIAEAGPEDVILIAGKGHENYQEIDGVRHEFDDVAVAAEQLKQRNLM